MIFLGQCQPYFMNFTRFLRKTVLIAMINVVVSLYYYVQVVKAAFLVEPEKELPAIHLSTPEKTLTAVMIIVIIAGGIFPRYLFQLAQAAIQSLL